MPFIPVPDAYEVVVTGAITPSVPFVNVFGYANPATLTQGIADAIGDVLHDAWAELLGGLSDSWDGVSCVVTDLNTATSPQFTAATFTPLAGTDTTNDLPWQTAALVSWSTGTRGRSFRGRTYLGGFCEDHSDGRDVSATLISAIEDWRAHLLGDGNFGVISRYSGVDPDTGRPIPRDEGIISPFVDGTIHPLWRTQRRRATR